MIRILESSGAPQNKTILSATRRVQEQLDSLTAFDTHRADLRKIMGAGIAALKGSPPLTKAQLRVVYQYEQSLPTPERVCLWLYRRHGKRSQEIADSLNVSVEWVRRTNARHFSEIVRLLYP